MFWQNTFRNFLSRFDFKIYYHLTPKTQQQFYKQHFHLIPNISGISNFKKSCKYEFEKGSKFKLPNLVEFANFTFEASLHS